MFQKHTLRSTGFLFLSGLVLFAYPVILNHLRIPERASGWYGWAIQPGFIFLLGIITVLYGRGWSIMHRQGMWPIRRLQHQAHVFFASLVILVIALLSPVAELAKQNIWVHALQHTLLAMVAAPLMVASYPLPALLLGLPGFIQRSLGQGWTSVSRLRPVLDLLSKPLTAWLLQIGLMWAWHTPFFEQEALRGLQDFTLFLSALLLW